MKKILILIFFICLPIVFSSEYLQPITYSIADLRYCMIGGDCVLGKLNVSELHTENQTVTNIDVLGDIDNRPYNIYTNDLYANFYDWISGDDWNTFDGKTLLYNDVKLNTTIDDKIATTYYLPSVIAVISGTYNYGDLNSIQSMFDNLNYSVQEDSGANPLEIHVNFTDVKNFDTGITRVWYDGSVQHTLDICLWNWNIELWECAWDIQASSYYEIISGSVFGSTNYISGGIVQMKYDHVGNGITSHVFYIDYVALSSGISAITSNEHDALSGRDDILHNHPNIIEVFYNQSQVNDSIDEKTKEFTKNSTDLTALNINANNLSVSQTSYTDGVWTYGYDDTSGFHIKMYINDIGRGVIQSEGELVLSSGTSLDNVYLNSSSSIYIDLGDNLADKVYIRNSGGSIGASLASTGNLDLISGDFTTTGDITTTGSAEIGIRTGYANPTQLIVHTGELWSLDEGNLISFPDIYPSLTMKAIGYEEGLSATRWTIENGAYSGALSVSDIDSYAISGQSTLQIGNSGEVVGGDFGLDLTLHYPDQDFSNTLINSNTTITGYTFLEKDLNVEGDALFEQNVSVLGNLSVGENTLMIDSSNMHMIATGNTPSLSCGSGGSIVGTDMAGKITCGDEPDPCTITFSAPYSVAPACVISGNINPMSSYVEVTTTTTTMVISPYQDISGDVISYICIGLG